jgi:hypothetical protein
MEHILFVSKRCVPADAGNKEIVLSIIGKGFSYRTHIFVVKQTNKKYISAGPPCGGHQAARGMN